MTAPTCTICGHPIDISRPELAQLVTTGVPDELLRDQSVSVEFQHDPGTCPGTQEPATDPLRRFRATLTLVEITGKDEVTGKETTERLCVYDGNVAAATAVAALPELGVRLATGWDVITGAITVADTPTDDPPGSA